MMSCDKVIWKFRSNNFKLSFLLRFFDSFHFLYNLILGLVKLYFLINLVCVEVLKRHRLIFLRVRIGCWEMTGCILISEDVLERLWDIDVIFSLGCYIHALEELGLHHDFNCLFRAWEYHLVHIELSCFEVGKSARVIFFVEVRYRQWQIFGMVRVFLKLLCFQVGFEQIAFSHIVEWTVKGNVAKSIANVTTQSDDFIVSIILQGTPELVVPLLQK